MKKTVKLLSLLTLSCVLLSGCSGNANSEAGSTEQISSVTENTSTTENSSSAESAAEEKQPESDSDAESKTESTADESSTENSETDAPVMPIDLDGTALDPDTMNCTIYSESNYTYYVFDGFAWLAEPTGQSYVTADGTIPKPIEYTQPEFKRLNVGDEINGLTILSAETEIDIANGKSFFNGCKAEFEGTSELTGYAFIQYQDDYMMPKDTIFFLPEQDGCNLPVIYSTNSHTLGDPIVYDGICWGNEYDRWFDLGNISDYSDKEWLALLPSNGTPVRVTATVSNVKMSYYNDSHMSGNGWLSCTIDDLKLAQ